MAASVDNRQYGLVDPSRSAVVHGYRSSPNTRSYTDHVFPKKLVQMDDSSSEDEGEYDWSNHVAAKEESLEPSILDSRDQATADNWIERNPSLIRLTGKHPFNCEPPLTQLMHHGFITPVPLHYVRNHGAVPMATWEEWTVEVTGLVKRPTRFIMDQLVKDFPSREFPVTLVCAGNRRKEQNMVKHSIGFNWGAAGVSTTVWRGVRLRDVLKRCGIYSRRKGAMNVCFEGAEDLPGGGGGSKYGTSIKMEFAMDPSRDIILAYMQNGEMLTPDHGFPIRMIIPGFIGGRMVKWLKRIIVTTRESENYYHYKDNRVLPSHVDAELANAEAWWYKPEYIINELNVNSVITTPCHEEMLPINSSTTQTSYTMKGYAYSGGGRKITRVELTMDEGESWMVCNLDIQEKPNKYGKYWCWCFWSLEIEVVDLIGVKEIAVRAWDESLNTQPHKLNWNVMGMMNNCWFRVKMNVCKPQKGEIGIMFEHPTQPANQPGGWMTRQKQPETSESTTTTTATKKSISSPSSGISMSEVNKHNSAESAWIVVHGQVYDCTRFLNDHPGGSDSILINAGTDCTEEFDAIHSERGKKMLEDYRIGELVTTTTGLTNSAPRVSTSETVTPKKNVALIPGEKIKCKMISKTHLSHDTRLFRFALPSEEQVLGLPVGKHIYVCATIDDKLCMRAYTPSSSVDEVGYFDLVIKVYFKGVNPKFPNGGLMSQFLDNIPLGATVDIKGPLGHIEYTGQGNFMVHGKNKSAKKLAMIAGGTGITPIYQVIQAILKDPKDETEMYLVYANRTEDDILLRDELDSWAEKHERLKVWYVVGKSIREGWKYSVGIVSESILREHLPEGSSDALALACGPPPMIQFAVTPNLEKMNYDVKNSLLVF